jgi:hypothetical protein
VNRDNDNEFRRTLTEARKSGSKQYFTGKPCKHGHIANRCTCDGQCMECSRIKSLKRFYKNQKEMSERARSYNVKRYAEDKQFRERRKDYSRKRRHDPRYRDKILENDRRRRENMSEEGREKQREYARRYQLERCAKSPKARLDRSMSGGIYKSLVQGAKGRRSWEALVGYSLADLMRHLKKKFLPGMSWENYGKGGWHIDHKIPKAAFNYTTPEHIDFKRCWALSNLQPMWGLKNISKGAKLDKPFQPSLALADNDNNPASRKAS